MDAPVEEQGWLYECLGQKPTLASVFSFGWGQTLALLVACRHITSTNSGLERDRALSCAEGGAESRGVAGAPRSGRSRINVKLLQ